MSKLDIFQTKKIYAGLALLILTVVIVGGAFALPDSSKTADAAAVAMAKTTTSSMAATPTPTPDNTPNTSMFKDGTYNASGMYNSPGGEETLYVTVTLHNGKIVDSKLKSGSNESISAGYQQDFIGGYKKFVTGKDITTIKLGAIAGSSLTALGFNEALQTIEQQAHV